jgi:hypothetical protein
MRQPYETLLGQFRDHWALAPYLQGDVPNFDGIMASSKLDSLSSGEITLLWVALAFWNGDRTARVADVVKMLDRPNRMRVAAALGQ